MSHIDDNKYRFKVKPGYPSKTEAYSRLDAIKQIKEWQKSGIRFATSKFGQKNISPQHSKTLLNFAQLWFELDQLEKEVKARKRKQILK
jgi:hypothetical protein